MRCFQSSRCWMLFLNLAQKFPAASQLPLKGIFQGIKLIGAILVGILMISLLIGQSPAILIQRS